MANWFRSDENYDKKRTLELLKKHKISTNSFPSVYIQNHSRRKSDKELLKNIKDKSKEPVIRAADKIELSSRKGKPLDPRIPKVLKEVDRKQRESSAKANIAIFGATGAGIGLGAVLSKFIDKDIKTDKEFKDTADNLKKQTKSPSTRYFLTDHPAKSYFSPKEDAVVSGKNKAIMAHEFGHVDAYKNKYPKVLGKKLTKLVRPLATFGPTAVALGIGGTVASRSDKDTKTDKFLRENAGAITAASSVPLLADEAYASIKGTKMLKKLEPGYSKAKALKTLLPAFGTYALGAVPAIAFAHYQAESAKKTRKPKKELNKLINKDG